MSETTSIQWTDATWNPVTGCTKVSPGCKHCYAETFAERWRGIPGHPYEQGFDLRLWPERLERPLRWRKPRRVFVNSMSDLFHEDVPIEFIADVWQTMADCRWHTFQVLTKRPERLVELYEWDQSRCSGTLRIPWAVAPLANVWIGVSVEDQERADERIPHLLQVPAAVRWLSVEPMLGPVDIQRLATSENVYLDALYLISIIERVGKSAYAISDFHHGRLSWVVIGGESGPGARPIELDWARAIVSQCRAAGVAVFVKQLGAVWARENHRRWPTGKGDPKGACMENWPEDLRVREYPE